MSGQSGVFSDFCQAWLARFPGSELPTAWEEDVRANLKKHKSRVSELREELEKEEVYVEYLDKLLADIERHRKLTLGQDGPQVETSEDKVDSLPSESGSVSTLNDENKRRSTVDHIEAVANEQIDLRRASMIQDSEASWGVAHDKQLVDEDSPFVTVINVTAAANANSAKVQEDKFKNTYENVNLPSRKPDCSSESVLVGTPPGSTALPPNLKLKRQSQVMAARLRAGSRESLNSVSSPTTPTSPMISSAEEFCMSPREGLGVINSSISSSNESCKEMEEEEEIFNSSSPIIAKEVKLVKPVRHQQAERSKTTSILNSGSLDKGFKQRGRPDGREVEDEGSFRSGVIDRSASSGSDVTSKANKVRELRANWEANRASPIPMNPVTQITKPERRSKLGSNASLTSTAGARSRDMSPVMSVRARMGSPSGKSHDSDDSENGWIRRGSSGGDVSPNSIRRVSGETRLDRLVRRPSGEKCAPPLPPPNKPQMRKPSIKPRSMFSVQSPGSSDHLYDIVAKDEQEIMQEEEYYDNHLLYSRGHTSDTMGSAGGSSADLGFDEPPLLSAQSVLKSAQSGLSLEGSGTLSSSDTDALSGSPSFGRENSVDEKCDYVNINYFIRSKNFLSAVDQSDDELENDEVATVGSNDSQSISSPRTERRAAAVAARQRRPLPDPTDSERLNMYKCILNSIVESEAIYLEGLSVMLQYMKAMKVTLTTQTPVIPEEDFKVIFYKIPELHDLHLTFHGSLKRQVEHWNGSDTIGHNFKMLASRMKIYAAFLNNYQKALQTLHKCTAQFPQFADLTRSIKLRTVKGQKQGQSLSLEDLLHKPIARVQKHCLCLQDLIKYTPEDSQDFVSLSEALKSVQNFVNDYNGRHTESLFPNLDRPQRHLVKNSFIVELSEGQRKLRHLLLFNDVLVSAKYKASGKNEKFAFQLKWYIPLCHLLIVEEPSSEPKETQPSNLVALKTQTASLRDQIYRIEQVDDHRGKRTSSQGSITTNPVMGGSGHSYSKASEKYRKKLAELEAQLVLASPSLLFQVSHKQGKAFSFFLSSEYERSQWVETLQVLQASLSASTNLQASKSMSMIELQNWITDCRKVLKTNMGSFLMRSPRDEPLLVGDLVFKVNSLQGLTRPSDLYVIVEVDSYGHYFKKSKTKMICNTMEPVWDEEFIIELEGSENLRILVYEQQSTGTVLRGRETLELSRTWLSNKQTEQRISMNDVVLTCSVKYMAFEETMRRVPASKPNGLFGIPITQVTQREKRAVPFIITSCIREVERRGITEVGIYRVSGSVADVGRLKKAYETNPYEAEQLLKECDIHSVAGILRLYLRDLPESLFTSAIYNKMFEVYTTIPSQDQDTRKAGFLKLFAQIPHNPNQACIVFLIEHMVRVSQYEHQNKMSLHNLATVFGPTLLHSGEHNSSKKTNSIRDQFATGTVDVMAQAGILHFFLTRRAKEEPIQIAERQV